MPTATKRKTNHPERLRRLGPTMMDAAEKKLVQLETIANALIDVKSDPAEDRTHRLMCAKGVLRGAWHSILDVCQNKGVEELAGRFVSTCDRIITIVKKLPENSGQDLAPLISELNTTREAAEALRTAGVATMTAVQQKHLDALRDQRSGHA